MAHSMMVFFPDVEPVSPASCGNRRFFPSKWRCHLCSRWAHLHPGDCSGLWRPLLSWLVPAPQRADRSSPAAAFWRRGRHALHHSLSFYTLPGSGALFFPVSSKIFWPYIHPRLEQQPQTLARILTGIALNFCLNFERFVVFKMSSHSRTW